MGCCGSGVKRFVDADFEAALEAVGIETRGVVVANERYDFQLLHPSCSQSPQSQNRNKIPDISGIRRNRYRDRLDFAPGEVG